MRRATDAPDASEVARLLREFGQRTALRGGNPYRAKAYARATDNLLARLTLEPLQRLVEGRQLPSANAADLLHGGQIFLVERVNNVANLTVLIGEFDSH